MTQSQRGSDKGCDGDAGGLLRRDFLEKAAAVAALTTGSVVQVAQAQIPAKPNGTIVQGPGPRIAQPGVVESRKVASADADLTKRAFEALARGDSSVIMGALDQSVVWSAVASRHAGNAATLDHRGAGSYLSQMARSISSGQRKLEIVSITESSGVVDVISAWSEGGRRGAECRNIVRFLDGKVVAVIERGA